LSVFKRFGPGDQIDNVLVLEPLWTVASGTGGWKGSPEGSASVSLYGGYNRKPAGVVREYRFQRTIQGTDSFGQLVRSEPITASINYVWATDEDLNLSQRSSTRWGHEHWKTVMRLYDYYSRRDPDYVTSSYNHYCLYFNSGSTNIVSVFDRTATGYRALPTGSFTMEAWFKPFTSGTQGIELTVFGRARSYRMYLSGSTGKLNFDIHSGSAAVHTSVTSSIAVTPLQWHHAAVSFDHTTLTGALYLDLQQVASFTYPSPIPSPNSYTGSLHIGASYGGAIVSQRENYGTHSGQARTAFHGFIGNVRVWGSSRSWSQISASHNVRLTGSGLAAPLLCDLHLSEGPLAYASPPTDVSGLITSYASGGLVGSGVLDHAAAYQAKSPDYGVLYKFSDRFGPVWHPNDNTRFYVPKEFALAQVSGTNWSPSGSRPVERLRILSIPAGFTGRQITRGSVRVTDNTYSAVTHGLQRTLIDDGRGGLYLSGSAALEPRPRKARGTYSIAAAHTSSIVFESTAVGPQANGHGVTQVNFGPAGGTSYSIDESDPFNVTIQIPVAEDGFTPWGTLWGLYTFMASSSVYFRPVSIQGNVNDIVASPFFTLGGGTFGSTGSYNSVGWNKVGNVFYDEGLIVIKDPALLDFAHPTDHVSEDEEDLLQLEFRGNSRIPVKTLMCRIDRGDYNASLNPTFYRTEEDGDRVRRHQTGSLYITTVGIYNSSRELVGVARLAEPLRVRPRDRMNVKLRLDF
jgi:hypothetical protein